MSEADKEHPHRILQRWVSLGDILVLVSALIVFAFGYGRLSRDVEALTRAVMELQSRDITPGASPINWQRARLSGRAPRHVSPAHAG